MYKRYFKEKAGHIMTDYNEIRKADPEIFEIMEMEEKRQESFLELIASENIVSKAVMQAAGSHLTNKYAEGYPGKRNYGGCEYVDMVEELAKKRAMSLFGAEYANVQPHSGSQANLAVFQAFMKPGDTLLGMDISHGGHITHGSPENLSGKMYNVITYGVRRDTETIDYDKVEDLIRIHRPRIVIAGASAYPRNIDFKVMSEMAHRYDALLMADMAHIAGLVAAEEHMNPVEYADVVTSATNKTLRGPRGGFILCREEYGKLIDRAVFPGTQGGPLMNVIAAKAVCFREAMTQKFRKYQKQTVKNAKTLAERIMANGIRVVSGGTDNHLILADVYRSGMTGKQAEILLDKAHITLNKCSIPFETLSPFETSGIRIGTPSVTSRGFTEKECEKIADLISLVINDGEIAVPVVRGEVDRLTKEFPIYR